VAHAVQEITGPSGVRLRFVRTAAETDGELLEMEATYAAAGAFPPEHLHPSQDERFTVLEGAADTVLEGVRRRYEEGASFDVPAGTVHQLAAAGPARLRWEVRPALRTAEFFEALYGGAAAEDFGAFLAEFADEIRFPA
jgi:quercetin dioxygenase-like cupin family protein